MNKNLLLVELNIDEAKKLKEGKKLALEAMSGFIIGIGEDAARQALVEGKEEVDGTRSVTKGIINAGLAIAVPIILKEAKAGLNKIKTQGVNTVVEEVVEKTVKETSEEVTEEVVEKGAKSLANNVDDMISETSYAKSIDFSKLGTGNVGDFSNLKGTTIEDILSRIPTNAKKRELTPIQGKVTEGFEYKFFENGETIRVRVHGYDQSAPIGSNAYDNWIVRVQKGKKYMDSSGKFHPPGISNPNSEFYDEIIIDDTHIPIKVPK
ncbi:MAG: polymorphic toxin type 30 domain-containing protein [Catonella sp.]|uniref:polymorphic toxin type 30 domain-containing protein n=1 Tax=Catonella sp. TaxID=2382125 RepID=UPI003FA112F0